MEMGFDFTEETEEADLILFNTCAVREHAENRVFGNVGALKKHKYKHGCIIILCGCMTQQQSVAEKIKESYENALLKEDIDYTIFMVFSMNTWNKQKSLLHCMDENDPYPGINMQTILDGFILSGANMSEEIGKTSNDEYLIPNNTGVKHSVFIRRQSNTITMITEAGSVSCEYTHNSVNKNLLIGAYQSSDGVAGRYADCTVYQARVWNRALSDDEISSYINGN